MTRWVVQLSDGSLDIIVTSGQVPPNAVCKAKPEYLADELSYDKASGVVFIDPDKVKAKKRALELVQRERDHELKLIKFKKIANKYLLPLGLIALGALIGKFII